ncbi:MAG: hypothetical protein EPO07_12600 [Verrucomicrobia bacterium]|nr:MAG: hypothetical protein EPO07_12600 [Verrucomicrobiota bacterium]
MNLDDAQKKKVSEWIAQGAKVSEIQTRLEKELGAKLTYMEVRFLMDDLKLTPKDAEPPKPSPTLTAPAAPKQPTAAAPDAAANPLRVGQPAEVAGAMPGGVSVGVDKVTRPGALVSGKVTFSDGQEADWYLDQTGRLGVVPKVQGYKPTQADVQDFQLALQDELAKMGL